VCLCLLLARVNAYVEYVATAKYYVAVVCRGRITPVFGCPFKYDVHVAVSVYHSSPVLDIVFQSDVNFRVEFLNEQVKRFS